MTEKEEGVITRPKVDVIPRDNKPRTMNRRLLLHFVHRNDDVRGGTIKDKI